MAKRKSRRKSNPNENEKHQPKDSSGNSLQLGAGVQENGGGRRVWLPRKVVAHAE